MSAEQVEAWYTEALQAARRWGSSVLQARVSDDYGSWLRRQGREDQAAELLGYARDVYERLEARAWLGAMQA